MAMGLVGKKCGMTRIFTDDGEAIPVSVVQVENLRVTRVKTNKTDGYNSVQVTHGSKRANLVKKAEAGNFAKAGVEAGRGLFEFRLDEVGVVEYKPGDEIKVDIFAEGQVVDVVGTSIGRGFSGVVRRHNFSTQDASHGNSLSHRAPGSTGQCQTPGRVFKGKKMAGQYGNTRTTVQNLVVIRVDTERGVILIKGAVPGAKGSVVFVKPAVKKRGK